jgi:DNA-directed RNA polymerase specialized sigma24 family protein
MDAPSDRLTPAQLLEPQPGQTPPIQWIRSVIRKRIPWALVNRHGQDYYEQEGWITLWLAAQKYDPQRFPNIEFGAYATFCLHRRYTRLRKVQFRDQFQVQWPRDRDGDQVLDPADYFTPPDQYRTMLGVWCDRTYRRQRGAALSWRQRVLLYLFVVEEWTLRELAEFFGQTHQAIHHAVKTIRELMRKYRECGSSPLPIG